MRAVLIATDFLKEVDNTFKVLEMNTNVLFQFQNILNYVNFDVFDEFIDDNNITKIKLILPQNKGIDTIDLENTDNITKPFFSSELITKYPNLIESTDVYYTRDNGTNIPNIEDDANTLILRISYDPTALIDDMYCKDNYEFLKLMYDTDPNLIPKTYVNDSIFGFDTIGETVRDNGIYPNYLIKERYPTTNYFSYPKIYKINTIEELNNLKNTLPTNTFLQEYIFNPNDLVDGKLTTHRVISVVYGDNLDVLDLFDVFLHSNLTPFSETVDYDVNNQLQIWERPNFLQKIKVDYNVKIKYHFDDYSKILLPDNTITDIENIQVGSTLKTLYFDGMPIGSEGNSASWSPTFNELETSLSITGTTIVNKSLITRPIWLKNITLANGSKFSDVEYGYVVSKKQNNAQYAFHSFKSLEIGDSFMLYNHSTSLLEESVITQIDYSYEYLDIYTIDVEDVDALLTTEDGVENPLYSSLQHNTSLCEEICCPMYGYSVPSNWNQNCECSGTDGTCTNYYNGYTDYTYEGCYDVGSCGYPSGDAQPCYQCVAVCYGCDGGKQST